MPKKILFQDREISWLDFNMRVLQEARDPATPLLERLRFLGIYSNNLDEFFRVRVASLEKAQAYGLKIPDECSQRPLKKVLRNITEITAQQEKIFTQTYHQILRELSREHIRIVDEKKLTAAQALFVRNYFTEKVRMHLFPIMVRSGEKLSSLRERSIHLAVHLHRLKEPKSQGDIAIIELPTDILSRFVILPPRGKDTVIIFLDDVVRFCLDDIFAVLGYTSFEAYTIKFTRNAELDLDNDISKSFLEIMSEGVKQRKTARPVRFIYDRTMPRQMLRPILRGLGIKKEGILVPGGRYHNFKDFMRFPLVGDSRLRYEPLPPVSIPDLPARRSVFEVMRSRDVLLHYPYHSFHYFIDLLREASLDPTVYSIKMTLYRLAPNSSIVNALINAARNGKKVTVFIELQARFDEEANIRWAKRLQEEGVHIIQNLPNLKVHAKLCLIKRIEEGEPHLYAALSTGNFNEETARLYCDDMLLTADRRITTEVEKVFDLFSNPYKDKNFSHLIVAPNHLRDRINRFIEKEIDAAKKGKPAEITLKLNSLTDPEMARNLVAAARSGVVVTLIIRGACVIMPDPGDPFLRAISIVDRFLEHSRIYFFHAGGKEKMFLSSADLMNRNLDRRIEIAFPVYDLRLKERLKTLLSLQLADPVKSRSLARGEINKYRAILPGGKSRSQQAFYTYLIEQYKHFFP